jgi:hypothetical protein
VTVYAAPAVSPVITIGEEEPVAETVVLSDVFLAVAMYPVIADPPTLDGAVNVVETCKLPAVVVPIEGAFGTFKG